VSVPSNPHLGTFASAVDYPMYVATVAAGSERGGCLVGFATQTSLEPVCFLVCISRANATARIAATASHVAVHLLGRDNDDLARLFGEESGDWTDKFARCRWSRGPHDAPVLDDAAGWFVGEVVDRVALGDHDGLVLAPVEVHEPQVTAFLTFQDLSDLEPGHPA
jgi:flavin reductase (DIM6/NTAB) family NADH-FMN oxidoreductase RutF